MPVVCSKTLESDYESASAAVDECLSELNLEKIDIFLLHEVRGVVDLQERSEAWRALRDKKASGLIRAIGISTHHVDACLEAANLDSCDVVFPLINKAGMGIRDGEGPGTRDDMAEAIKLCSIMALEIHHEGFRRRNIIEDM